MLPVWYQSCARANTSAECGTDARAQCFALADANGGANSVTVNERSVKYTDNKHSERCTDTRADTRTVNCAVFCAVCCSIVDAKHINAYGIS